MSQSGMLTVADGVLPPDVPTSFVTNSGSAHPAANTLNVLGSTVASGSIPFRSIGSGNTVTYQTQISQAIAGTDATKIGLSAFNSSQFTVDGNGFVSSLASMTDLHVARFIVSAGGSADGANYTTISLAYAAAVAAGGNQTVFLQPGTYSENLTLVAGINLTAFDCDALTPNVTINGKLTATFVGSCTISGIRLQTNSDFCLAVTGSSGTIITLKNCFVSALNNTAISFTSSSSASRIYLIDCRGDISTTGIAYFSMSALGNLRFIGGFFENNGSSTTASTNSSASTVDISLYTVGLFSNSITTSNSGIFASYNSQYVGALILNGTSGLDKISNCLLNGGTASSVSIGSGSVCTITNSDVNSSNTNALTGSGTLKYGLIAFSGTSSTVNTSTVTALATLI